MTESNFTYMLEPTGVKTGEVANMVFFSNNLLLPSRGNIRVHPTVLRYYGYAWFGNLVYRFLCISRDLITSKIMLKHKP